MNCLACGSEFSCYCSRAQTCRRIADQALISTQPSSDGEDDLATEIERLRTENSRIKQKLASAADSLRKGGVVDADVQRLTRSGASAAQTASISAVHQDTWMKRCGRAALSLGDKESMC